MVIHVYIFTHQGILISGVTKTQNGKRNGMKTGMKWKICNAIYIYLRKTCNNIIHYLNMNHPSFPLTIKMYLSIYSP